MNSKVLWIDLETTGSDFETSQILEVGAVITDYDLNILSTKTMIVKPTTFSKLSTMTPFVMEMHTKNGLLADIMKHYHYDELPDIGKVDKMLTDWVTDNNSKSQIALAGSGVLHFDRQFIRRDFPTFDKHLTYWGYDVGVIRRFLRDFLKSDIIDETHENAHRGLQDVLDQIEEMKKYIRYIKELQENAWKYKDLLD
jgi:oligoribonuclease